MNSIPENNASQQSGWPSIPVETDLAVPTCGTPDPYVNLPKSDSMQSESSVTQPQIENTAFDPTAALERALEKLENCRGQLQQNEEGATTSRQQSEAARAQAALLEELALKQNETPKEAQSNFEEPIGLNQDLEEPDYEFEAEFDNHVYGPQFEDLALDLEAFEGLAEDQNETSISAESESSTKSLAIPLYAEEQRSPALPSEPVFDVRDFLDSSKTQPEPIPGSYQVDPYFYDFQTAEDAAQPMPEPDAGGNSATRAKASPEVPDQNTTLDENMMASSPVQNPVPTREDTTLIQPALDDQLFVANAGDVIQIDGSDGFDHIDLACFDVEHANVVNDVIFVDDKDGAAFEIRFRNVDYALFSGGNTIDLSGTDS